MRRAIGKLAERIVDELGKRPEDGFREWAAAGNDGVGALNRF
jgi:hypothetical protein